LLGAAFYGDTWAEKAWDDMGVSKNRGGGPKWMVKIMENPIKMDDLKHPYRY